MKPQESESRPEGAPTHRHIRSFGTRRGHFTAGQRDAYDKLMPRHGIAYRAQALDAEAIFGRKAPLVLEIGCGMGETTAAIAAAQPDIDFIGVEVYPAGVGALLRRIDEAGIANLRVIEHDAVEVVRDMIAPASLAGVHVFFPDPWPKKRHHKRRLIQPTFVALLASRIAPGGYLHCATDWAPYAIQMLEVLGAEPLLANSAGPVRIAESIEDCAGFAPRPTYRPLTKFEQRGLRLGHGVWDLVFEMGSDSISL
ncbi:MAG: tRNA (guanosine(46)-N7)-methyltransferase TrmB [Burkholderiaceae bacterium]